MMKISATITEEQTLTLTGERYVTPYTREVASLLRAAVRLHGKTVSEIGQLAWYAITNQAWERAGTNIAGEKENFGLDA